MKPPIIVNANGDIYMYDSLEGAERDIEPPDVLNGIYTIYDSLGLVLQPVVLADPKYDVVKIHQTNENRQPELRQALIDFLMEIDNGKEFDKMPLHDLVAALEIYRTR